MNIFWMKKDKINLKLMLRGLEKIERNGTLFQKLEQHAEWFDTKARFEHNRMLKLLETRFEANKVWFCRSNIDNGSLVIIKIIANNAVVYESYFHGTTHSNGSWLCAIPVEIKLLIISAIDELDSFIQENKENEKSLKQNYQATLTEQQKIRKEKDREMAKILAAGSN